MTSFGLQVPPSGRTLTTKISLDIKSKNNRFIQLILLENISMEYSKFPRDNTPSHRDLLVSIYIHLHVYQTHR